MERQLFDLNYIIEELKKIGVALPRRVDLYLIGGGALAFHRLKEATKDLDLIATSLQDVESLVETLEGLGYQTVIGLPKEYKKMSASAVLRNTDGFQLDIFHQRVCNALVLSQGMIDRSNTILEHEKLNIHIIAKEDILLFKGMTERAFDLEDMRTIAESGVDWDTVSQECLAQSASSESVWETLLYDSLVDLEDRYGIRAPISKKLRKIAEEKMTERLLIRKVEEGKHTVREIAEEFEYSESWVRIELKKLAEKGLLRIDNSKRPYRYQLQQKACAKTRS